MWRYIGMLVGLVLLGGPLMADEVGARVRAMTGARTRVLWLSDQSGKDQYGTYGKLLLCGLDTDDGKGIRRILPTAGKYRRPLITPRGNRVVYSDAGPKKCCYVLNWDGTGRRKITNGLALVVWDDPKTGLEWVYVQLAGDLYENRSPTRGQTPIYRYQLDNPSVREPVWVKPVGSGDEAVDVSNFQLSADGTHASGCFPWPRSAIVEVPNGRLFRRGRGCWISMAPDNSYRFWHSDGPHRHLVMYDWPHEEGREVAIDTAPGINGQSVYFPRWSNHPRFMSMTGPGIGGKAANVYIGKFNEPYTAIAQWVQVTNDTLGDSWPEVWIAGGSPASKTGTPATEPPAPAIRWPAVRDDLLFAWAHRLADNALTDARGARLRGCTVEPQGAARYSPWNGMEPGNGWFATNLGAQELLTAVKQSRAFSLEALVTPHAATTPKVLQILTIAGAAQRNFFLGQEGDHYLVWCATSGQPARRDPVLLPCGNVTAGAAQHLLITYAAGTLTCYLDGEVTLATRDYPGDLSAWVPGQLVIGNNTVAPAGWRGAVDGVALFTRALTPAEVRAEAAPARQRAAGRVPPPRCTVRATLLEATPLPEPQAILPYRHGLVAHRYRVDAVEGGTCAPHEIIVVSWAIRDGAAVPGRTRARDTRYRLTLEPYDAHAELMSENVTMDLGVFDLPMYYEIEAGPAE